MTPEQQAAFIISQSAAAMITAMGYAAENKSRELQGLALAYPESAFQDLIPPIGHNTVLQYFQDMAR